FEDGFESGDLCAWTDDSGSGPTCRSHGWFWERDHVYRDGQLLAEVGELNVLHRHVDHLGSLRQVTDEQGIWQEDHAYLPFGEEVPASSRVPLQFTGHERDSHGAGSADDLDYMHARYCSPTMGRFLSVDPVSSSSPRKPQSWNKYAYALDNPIKFLDPDGRTVVGFYGSGGSTIGGVGAALDALIPHTAAVGGVRGFYGGFYPPSGVEEAVSFITSDRRRAPETSLVLFGHSRGAVSALKTARLLAQGGDSAAVDLLVTADPALNLPGSRVVPPNVRTAINFFQLSLGVNLRGDTLRAADPSRTNVFNIQLDATHTGIDEAVAQAIVSFVLDLAASGQLGHLEEGLQFLQGQLINVMAE
ncbi:MAG: RHS repeat-associated core domain-containing protein, partial [Thermoanaerobaculia bacterium]